MELKELKCKNCGSPLEKDLHCPYCGTRYERDYSDERIRVVEHCVPIVTLGATARIPDYFMKEHPEEATEMTLDDLAHELAEGLKGYMKLSAERDFNTCGQIINASVRILPPDWRF